MKRTLLSFIGILAFSMVSFAQLTYWDNQTTNLAASRGITDIMAVDANIVWAAAYDGVTPSNPCVDVIVTSDAGTTWTKKSITGATGVSIANVCAVDASKCWAITYYPSGSGNKDGVYYTSDGGTTWTQQTTAPFSNANSFPNCVWFWDANNGYCMGDPINGEYEIYTTTNGGTTWNLVPGANIANPLSGEYGVVGYQSVIGNTVWFGTTKGRIYKSTDRGLNWTVAVCTPLNTLYIQPYFKNDTYGLAMDKSASTVGALAKSVDGGATWTAANNVGNTMTNDMDFISGSTWYSTGGNSGSSYSFDDGITWLDFTETIGFYFLATDWLNDSTGWAGSFVDQTNGYGGMWKFNSVLNAPVPAFSASDTAVALGDPVTFTDESTGGITAWQWTFQGGIPATSNVQNPPPVVFSTPGDHDVTLKVTNQWGYNTLVKTGYIYVGGVGIDEQSAATITVFPNPVKDVMNVLSSMKIQEVQLFNVVGQQVYSQKADRSSVTLNVANLSSGIYTMKIKLQDGYVNKKVVIE